jgi:hypothetical protein
MRRGGYFPKNSIAFVSLVIFLCCFIVVIVSVSRLPEITLRKATEQLVRSSLGKFGEMMVEMLPDDLAFTIFIPSEKSFERDLKLRANDSSIGEKANDTHAILTRVLSFTAVPCAISSDEIPNGEGISYDSLCGLSLFMFKNVDGSVTVNGIRSQRLDLKKRKIVLHVMDGVIMEAEFEQSVRED